MKYYPSTILVTKESRSVDLVIEKPGIRSFSSKNAELVVVRRNGDQLHESRCPALELSSFTTLKSDVDKAILTINVSESTSARLKLCLTEKNQYLAVRVLFPDSNGAEGISNQQSALIPLVDMTQGSILTEERTATVLGVLQRNLRLTNFTCDKRILFKENEISCSGDILNTTDSPVLASIITYAREVLPPGFTKYGNLERTNLLLLPGQTYTFSVTVPQDKLTIPGTRITVVSTFSALDDDTNSFTAMGEQTIYIFPLFLIGIIVSSLLIFSAILYRIKRHKFTSSPNGPSHRKE